MWFKRKEPIPRRPEICGTPMASAVEKRDKCAVKQAYDYQYNQSLAIYEWDLRYNELSDIEAADIQIKIGQLREFQKENGFGPWYHETDVENKIKFKDE
jgi:hypothetical protein